MKRRIVIIIGSASDLKQCLPGLEFLKNHPEVEVIGVYIRSIHRNTEATLSLLRRLSKGDMDIETAIVGAGWANHLTGTCDAYFRYELKDARIRVIGVAFEDLRDETGRHNLAAQLSISEVPGTKVTYKDGECFFSGEDGFLLACQLAAQGDLPEIVLPKPKEPADLRLEEAIEMAK
jgi:phosphoribosylcarboxyaminoimidazole (NCAIR) mutase